MKKYVALLCAITALGTACDRDRAPTAPSGEETGPLTATSNSAGYVYAATNATNGNSVVVFKRASDGSLSMSGSFATGGLGNGTGLGSQGSLIVSDGGRWLFVVNAGSSEVSVFRISGGSLVLTDKVGSGGDMPVSLTFRKGLLYVLNAKRSGNITGFTLDDTGNLTPLANSTRPLSGADSVAPAQIEFVKGSNALVVTERATDLITTYALASDGTPGAPQFTPSAGIEPFGFAITRTGYLVVSEAADGIPGASTTSSYGIAGISVNLVSGAVANGQTAACWLVVTQDQRVAFVVNTGTATVSSYQVGDTGGLTLLQGAAANTGAGSVPIDATIQTGFLYVLNQATGEIDAFGIGANGTLTPASSLDALPPFAAGLAQF